MLRLKTFISSISNLTDARYYAAIGVDWISFDISNNLDFIPKAKEIIDWIEGPKIAIELTDNITAIETMLVDKIKYDAIIVPFGTKVTSTAQVIEKIVLTDISEWSSFTEKLNLNTTYLVDATAIENTNSIVSVITTDNTFILHHPDTSLTAALITNNKTGVALYGGEEERVGYKSFDDIDAVFDLLEEE